MIQAAKQDSVLWYTVYCGILIDNERMIKPVYVEVIQVPFESNKIEMVQRAPIQFQLDSNPGSLTIKHQTSTLWCVI